MNRATKRKSIKEMGKQAKAQAKQKFDILDVQRAINVAYEMNKSSGGHLYIKDMDERCIFCGANRKAKKDCKHWFMTFLDRLQTILVNPGFFQDDEIEAQWLQHGDQYKEIRILNVKN